jgi:hypothetical protein
MVWFHSLGTCLIYGMTGSKTECLQ